VMPDDGPPGPAAGFPPGEAAPAWANRPREPCEPWEPWGAAAAEWASDDPGLPARAG
jgi:hypothetical protein